MTLEMGKPLPESKCELAYGAPYFQWFAEEAVRSGGRTAESPAGNGQIVTIKKPVGPVLAITPWNFPLVMATRKIAPALAVDCPVIVKPAGQTPLTMLLLGSSHHGCLSSARRTCRCVFNHHNVQLERYFQ